LNDPGRLGTKARAILENPANELTVSVGTIWELCTKTGLRKLSLWLPYRQWVERALADLGMAVSPITLGFTEKQMALPLHPGGPFDQFLVAQCLVETIPLASADAVFDRYGITRLWD
jgi:PIN domain nuclease of toxin-antitoxin system